MASVLASLDVLVLPSLEDSLPLAILEAMASRIPVVASTVGGIPECVYDGKTGYLTRPGNVEDVVVALTKLVTDGRLRERMGQAARQRIIDDFSPESQVPLVEQTFRLAAAA
jgi:glycosyltransferase involved in cell wall biosynthesis